MYERYCQLRDKKGLKDGQLAKQLDITASTFSDWKKGKSTPNAEKLLKISKALGVSLEYLLTGHEETFEEASERINTEMNAWEYFINEMGYEIDYECIDIQNDKYNIIFIDKGTKEKYPISNNDYIMMRNLIDDTTKAIIKRFIK